MPITYTVRYGDSLFLIAKYYGVSLETLAKLNSIYYPYTIFVGQKIIIPDDEMDTQNRNPAWESVEEIFGKKGSIQNRC
jgi:LysM repeat protein